MPEQRFPKSVFEDGLAGFSFTSDLAHRMLVCGKLLKAVLVREPDNQYDPNAVRVDVNGVKVGYVPRGRTSYQAYRGITCGWANYSKAGEKNVPIAKALDGGIKLAAAVQWQSEWGVSVVDCKGSHIERHRRTDFSASGFPPRLYIFAENMLPEEVEEFSPISEESLAVNTQFVNFAKISYTEPNSETFWQGGDLYYVRGLDKFAVWGGHETLSWTETNGKLVTTSPTIAVNKGFKIDHLPFIIIEEADIHFDKLALQISPSYGEKAKAIEQAVFTALTQIPGNKFGKYESQLV